MLYWFKKQLTYFLILYYFWYYEIKNYKINFNKVIGYAGAVDYDIKTLFISQYFIKNSNLFELYNVLLHEIAHILIDQEKEAHGPLWLKTFTDMGGNGNVTTNFPLYIEDYPWVLSCSNKNCCLQDIYCFKRTKLHCSDCGSYLQPKLNRYKLN
tara:strand:- start:13819 stop:14280 length:462 start_codon:yes stop_codon:yes gene_type:complete